jgi:hypothetical protein
MKMEMQHTKAYRVLPRMLSNKSYIKKRNNPNEHRNCTPWEIQKQKTNKAQS